MLVFRDVTERKQAEDARVAGRAANIRTITDTVPALIALRRARRPLRSLKQTGLTNAGSGHSRGEINREAHAGVLEPMTRGGRRRAEVDRGEAPLKAGQTLPHYEAERQPKGRRGHRWIDATYVPNPARPRRGRREWLFGAGERHHPTRKRGPGGAALRTAKELLAFLIDRSPTGGSYNQVDKAPDFSRISHINADSQARAFRNVNPAIGRRLDDAMRILWPEPLATEIIASSATRSTPASLTARPAWSVRADLDSWRPTSGSWTASPCRTGCYGVVCYFYDTTRLRVAEAEARESESVSARWPTTSRNWRGSPTPEPTGSQLVNQNWFDYTGTTLDRSGSGLAARSTIPITPSASSTSSRTTSRGLDWEDTFPLRGKDGQFRWFLSRMKVIRNESGLVERIFGTNTDVTEQRAMADKLRQQAADLSEADRRKNEFLATLAHESRPLPSRWRSGTTTTSRPDEGEHLAREDHCSPRPGDHAGKPCRPPDPAPREHS